jgi:hypothetical protein
MLPHSCRYCCEQTYDQFDLLDRLQKVNAQFTTGGNTNVTVPHQHKYKSKIFQGWKRTCLHRKGPRELGQYMAMGVKNTPPPPIYYHAKAFRHNRNFTLTFPQEVQLIRKKISSSLFVLQALMPIIPTINFHI